jgi:CNT family concentrative nucleoside transporter
MAWQGALGIVLLPALAWAIGDRRREVRWRLVFGGVALQVALAFLLLRFPASTVFFHWVSGAVDGLQTATRAGTSFVFGYLGGADLPFSTTPAASTFVLALQALPLILVMSALSALLFYWRVLPAMVGVFAWLLDRSLGIGGVVGVVAAANVFLGMIEAPLLVRPYLANLSRAGLFMVMCCGMATIAGTVFVVYGTILAPVLPDAAGHLLTASLLNAPGALVIAALMCPEPEAAVRVPPPSLRSEAGSSFDAVVRGTTDGTRLLIAVMAMLIVMIALVSLVNQLLGLLPEVGGRALGLERILGWVMAPLAWLLGIPWAEAATAGQLLGVKVVLNEFIAYARLADLPAETLSAPSRLILAYALCGFANFGSLGILIGGLTAMLPERRAEIIALGPRSIAGGTLAGCLTAAVAGLLH